MKIKGLFILILCLLLVFAGCKKSAEVQTTTQPTEIPAPKLGLLLKDQQQDERAGLQLQEHLQRKGWDVLVQDGKNDQSRQNEQVKQLLEQGCEVLVIQPVMTSGLDVLIGQIKPSGVPVILLDAIVEQSVLDLYDKLTVVCPKEEKTGTIQAQLLPLLYDGGDMNGDGTVSMLLICGPEDHIDAKTRAEEFQAGLKENHIILETVTADWTAESAKSAVLPLLAQYGPDIEVIVTFCGEMAQGAIEAAENGGWVPGDALHILTIGGESAVINEVNIGRISGTAAPDSAVRLDKIAELCQLLKDGQIVDQVHYISWIPVVYQPEIEEEPEPEAVPETTEETTEATEITEVTETTVETTVETTA